MSDVVAGKRQVEGFASVVVLCGMVRYGAGKVCDVVC